MAGTPSPIDPALRRRAPYLSLGAVIGLFFLAVVLGLTAGHMAASIGIVGAGIYFYSALGFASVTPVAYGLYWLDLREENRARAANERLGWDAVEADTARRIAEMRRRRAQTDTR